MVTAAPNVMLPGLATVKQPGSKPNADVGIGIAGFK